MAYPNGGPDSMDGMPGGFAQRVPPFNFPPQGQMGQGIPPHPPHYTTLSSVPYNPGVHSTMIKSEAPQSRCNGPLKVSQATRMGVSLPMSGSTLPLSHFGNGSRQNGPGFGGFSANSVSNHQQIRIFTTALANSAAAAVNEGKYSSIIDYHRDTVDKKEHGSNYAMSITPPAFSQSGAIQTQAPSAAAALPFPSIKTEPIVSMVTSTTSSVAGSVPSVSIAKGPESGRERERTGKRSRTGSMDGTGSSESNMNKAPSSVPPFPSFNPSTPLERAASVSATSTAPTTPTFHTGASTMASVSQASDPLVSNPMGESRSQAPPGIASSSSSKISSISSACYSSASPKSLPLGNDPLSQMERLANESLPLEPPLKQQRLTDSRTGPVNSSGKEKQISQRIVLDDNELTPLERKNRQENLEAVIMLREQLHLDNEMPRPDGMMTAQQHHMMHPQAQHGPYPYHPHHGGMMPGHVGADGVLYPGPGPGPAMPPHGVIFSHGGYDPHKQAWEELVAKHENAKVHQNYEPPMGGAQGMGSPVRGQRPPGHPSMRMTSPYDSVPPSSIMGGGGGGGMYGGKPTVMVAPQNSQFPVPGFPRGGGRMGGQRMFLPPQPHDPDFPMSREEMMMQQSGQWRPRHPHPQHAPGTVMSIRGGGQATMQSYSNTGYPPGDVMMISEGYGGMVRGGPPHSAGMHFPPSDQQLHHHPDSSQMMMPCGPGDFSGSGNPGMEQGMMMMGRNGPQEFNGQQGNAGPGGNRMQMMGGNGSYDMDFQGHPASVSSHPPTVNNTYVNATMSIQQLNIQNVGPPIGHGGHGGPGGIMNPSAHGGHQLHQSHPGGPSSQMASQYSSHEGHNSGSGLNMAIFQGLAEPITNLDSKVPSKKLQYFPADGSLDKAPSALDGGPPIGL